MGKVGQPKITFFVKFCIAYKVMQYQRRWNVTPFKAWMMFSNHRGFKDLMQEHYKNRASYLLENILGGPRIDGYSGEIQDPRKNFYKNHIRKIIEQFKNIKIYTPKEFKEYKAKIKAKKVSGIASLKNIIKKTR